ncbi:MAG: hypothetical protein ACLR06_13770 [Christensenellaceae bacterium]
MTEGGYGYYIFATNEGGTLEASVADRVVRITVTYEGPAVMHGTRFDGIVDENDAAYSAPFSFLTLDSQSQNNEVTVYINVAKDGVGFALVMASRILIRRAAQAAKTAAGWKSAWQTRPTPQRGFGGGYSRTARRGRRQISTRARLPPNAMLLPWAARPLPWGWFATTKTI